MWDGVIIRQVNLDRESEVAAVRAFLDRFSLRFDTSVDYTIALFKDETMVATGSLSGEVLRNFAVDETLQGEGLTATIISELMREAGARGVYLYFIFTRPDKAFLFASLGFNEIARAEPHAAVLESRNFAAVSLSATASMANVMLAVSPYVKLFKNPAVDMREQFLCLLGKELCFLQRNTRYPG